MPKPDRDVSALERWLFRTLPFTQKLARGLYWMLESRVLGFAMHPKLMKNVQKIALRHIRKQCATRRCAAVTPDYTIGCKRVLISNDYYRRCRAERRRGDDRHRPHRSRRVVMPTAAAAVDCSSTAPASRSPIRSARRDHRPRRRDIVDAWRDGAHAYLGTTLPGYPNFFLVGPNTGLGHNSMVFMIESQIEYVLDALRR
jgi:cation diffusion facilitator CzcD-associated flavoprotein CzcO